MDKYEYKLRLEEIKTLNKKGRFQEAAQVADTIDWKKVRNITTLGIISDVYKVNRRFEDAKEILLLANERNPQNRRILYSLCDLTIKMGQVVEAVEYYKEFVQMAPNDNSKYILLYKIYEAQDISLEERIAVLKEYKKREYVEKWAYELAFLYHRVGLATECVEECDQLILWFGEGRYVTKAMELKRLYVPLPPEQQQAYDRQFGKREPEETQPETPATEEQQEAAPKEDTQEEELDIQVKTMDMGQYNTLNLQAALAESMREVLEPGEKKDDVTPAAVGETEKNVLTQDTIPFRQGDGKESAFRAPEDRRKEYGGDDVEYQEDVTKVILDSAGWNAQETGQLDLEEEEEAAITAPAGKTNPHQERISKLLSQEYDGQISLALPEEPAVEKQITGQMNFEDVLAEWEARKKENEEKRKESIRKIIMDQTGSMFEEYDESVKNGILQKLERGEPISEPVPEKAALPDPSPDSEVEELEEIEEPQVSAAEAYVQPAAEPANAAARAEQAAQGVMDGVLAAKPAEQPVEQPAQPLTEEQPAETQKTEQEAAAAKEPSAQTEEPAQDTTARKAAQDASGQTEGEEADALNARIREQQMEDRIRNLTKEEKERFAAFIPTKGAMRQLIRALDMISLSAYTGNMIITGPPSANMMRLAKNIVKELRETDQNFSGKAARVSGDVLSMRKPEELIARIPNGALIVEQAGKLTDAGAQSLAKALNQESTGIVVFLLDSKRSIAGLLERCPDLTGYFTARFDIAALDSATLVKYGCQYAFNQEYAIDEMGRLAMHTRIEDMQTSDHAVTAEEVRQIVDEAIAHAERFSFKHIADTVLQKRYDDNDMIVLRERDFLHR